MAFRSLSSDGHFSQAGDGQPSEADGGTHGHGDVAGQCRGGAPKTGSS